MITELATEFKKCKIPQQVIDRQKHKYPNFPELTPQEYDHIINQIQITDDEFNVIHAMQSAIALDILESKLTNQSYSWLKSSYHWVDSYRPDFKGYDEAKEHLEKVDKNLMDKHGKHYTNWWIGSNIENPVALLNWSEVMVDRAIQKYGERTKPKHRSSVLASFE